MVFIVILRTSGDDVILGLEVLGGLWMGFVVFGDVFILGCFR